MSDNIQHISDTSLWIAGYRALETDRPDAVFHDHLAKKLAGDRGMEMVRITPNTKAMAFAMTLRTTGIDHLVEIAVANGVDTVINLGAGLDTRPYRMKLPPSLHWIEVDFDHLIAYKEKQLAGEQPVCRLERIPFDLSNEEERRRLFAQLGATTQKALIITEGVIGYLTNEQAMRLANDLKAIPSFHYWIHDFREGTPQNNRFVKGLRKMLKHTPLRFTEPDPLGFFAKAGWKVYKRIGIIDEAMRVRRRPPFMFPISLLAMLFPKKVREKGNKTYGYVMYERA